MSPNPEVFIIAVMTADGFIARSVNELASWSSKEDKQRYIALTKEAGVMVMGATTFRTFPKPLPGRHHVIYSRTEKFEEKWLDGNVETTNANPTDLIAELANKGFSKIAICGGSSIYSQFINAGVVTKVYLTIEPIMFGDGIKLFNQSIPGDCNLILDQIQKSETGTIFLDYSVVQK